MKCDTMVSSEVSYQTVRLNSKTISSVDNRNCIFQQSLLLSSRFFEKKKNQIDKNDMIRKYNINIIVHYIKKYFSYTYKDIAYYKEWAGMSPTVNVSWSIAKAYLANLY